MARKKKVPEADNELRWLTTYGDVVTLLLAFFVMLYAISQVDQQKFLLFVSGLEDPFGNPATSEGLLGEGSGIVGAAHDDQQLGEERLNGIALLDGLPEVIDQSDEVVDPQEPAPQQGGGGTLATSEDLLRVRASIQRALEGAGFGDVVDYEIDTRGLVIAIATDDVLFASGSAAFGQQGEEIIAVIAPTFHDFTNEILVEGHTDSAPLTAAGYDNWNLSTDRALAVLKLLTVDHAIEATRLAATGFGEHRPRTTNDTEKGKAANRRVELVIVAERGDPNG